MLDIMIVDDEYIVREGLRNGIPWEEYGYRVIGEAENGEEALEKIQTNCPDILLTDIKMPVMDGFELLKQVEELKLNIKVIILTCYDDFQYAQKAIHYGVEEYILKLSSRPREILKIVERVKKKIYDERRHKRIPFQNKAIPYFNEGSYYKQHSLDSCFFIYLELDDGKQNGLLQKESIEYDLLIEIDTIFKGYSLEIYRKSRSSFIMHIRTEDDKAVKQMCLSLAYNMKEKRNINLWMGVNKFQGGRGDKIQICIDQAKKACEYRFYDGNKIVYMHDETNYKYVSFKIDELKVIGHIENLMRSELGEYADKMMEEIKYIPITDLFNYCVEFIYIIVCYMKKNDIKPPDNLKNVGCIFNHFLNFYEYSLLKKEMLQVIEQLIDLIEGNVSGDILIVRRIKEIIDNKYASELTLEEVAEELNMSYCYISSLFKTRVGYSFTEYLNRYRVNKAKELLKEGDENIYLVSEKVGYSSPYYFNRVFKKYTNMTPNEYRNNFGI